MGKKKKTKPKSKINEISKLLASIATVLGATTALLKVVFEFIIQILELGQ